MTDRHLGTNGFKVSEVGLGCWQIGADWGKALNETQSIEILETAVTNGINFFDTADVYGNGRSESLIGKFLKRSDAKVKVATKFGRNSNVFPNNYTKDTLRASVEGSLERLGLQKLDLLQLHCVPFNVLKQGAIFDWLRELKEEGLIDQFGASVETVEEGIFCIEQEGIASLQVIFNILRQKLVTELLPKAEEKGVGIIVRLPLASGLLTGKFSKTTTFAKDDHRNYNKDGAMFNVGETFAGLPFEKGIDIIEGIRNKILPDNLNMVQLALRWILDHKAVSTIIPGASSPKQVISNASVAEIPSLSEDIHEALTLLYAKGIHEHIRGVY